MATNIDVAVIIDADYRDLDTAFIATPEIVDAIRRGLNPCADTREYVVGLDVWNAIVADVPAARLSRERPRVEGADLRRAGTPVVFAAP